MSESGTWRPCNVCKKPISFGATFWVCSVSTCNRKRTRLHFCSVECWDAHLPGARHREAWAEEEKAPSTGRSSGQTNASPSGAGTTAKNSTQATATDASATDANANGPRASGPGAAPADEVLIVASRLKQYIRAESGMSTSDRVLGPLSDVVRQLCDLAIESARRAERGTVLDRDVPPDAEPRPAWLGR
jgi:hypothetical protein